MLVHRQAKEPRDAILVGPARVAPKLTAELGVNASVAGANGCPAAAAFGGTQRRPRGGRIMNGEHIIAELDSFDDTAEILQARHDGMAPEPALQVSEWADKHRMFGSRGSAEPGRTSRTPYPRDVMDARSPAHPTRRVVLVKGAQVVVHGLLGLDREPLSVYRGQFDPRMLYKPFIALHDPQA